MRLFELIESKVKPTGEGNKIFSPQVKATEKAKNIPVGKWGTKHPFNGRLVGEGS